MTEFEIFDGPRENATLIGRVVAAHEREAINTLNSYRKGYKVTDPGKTDPPNAYVVWAHPKVEELSASDVPFWRLWPVESAKQATPIDSATPSNEQQDPTVSRLRNRVLSSDILEKYIQPPWLALPKIPWGSIGWRMGAGEDYWWIWVSWFMDLSQEKRDTYKHNWPEPEGWIDFYTAVETRSLLEWSRAHYQRMSKPIRRPQADEQEIHGYYRVFWLIDRYFKFLREDRTSEEESTAEIFEAPDGARWRWSVHATRGDMHLTKLAGDDG